MTENTATTSGPGAISSGKPAAGPSSSSRSSIGEKLLSLLESYALVLGLAGLIVCFSVLPATSSSFPTVINVQNLLATQTVIGIAAIAMMIPLICGQFDITIGAVLGISSYATASALHHGVALAPAIAIAIAICVVIGCLNGFIVAYLKANSIIITLAMGTFLTGMVSLYSKDQTLVGIPKSLSRFGTGYWLEIPRATWILLVGAILIWYMLRSSVFGRRLLMTGANPRAAELNGVPTRWVTFSSFVLSSTLAGVAGVIALSLTGSASPTVGPGYTLPAVSAAFLGSTTIRPGRFNVPGTIVGVFFVGVIVNGFTLAGAADWVDPVFNGASVVVAVTVSTILRNRRRTRRTA